MMKPHSKIALRMARDDQERLALLRRLVEETRIKIAESLAIIDWTSDAIGLLDRLQALRVSTGTLPRS